LVVGGCTAIPAGHDPSKATQQITHFRPFLGQFLVGRKSQHFYNTKFMCNIEK
jgi:hypothetical protein